MQPSRRGQRKLRYSRHLVAAGNGAGVDSFQLTRLDTTSKGPDASSPTYIG